MKTRWIQDNPVRAGWGIDTQALLDPATLSLAAIAAALPYVVELGKEAAKSAAGAAGKSVWEWVKGKLTSEARNPPRRLRRRRAVNP